MKAYESSTASSKAQTDFFQSHHVNQVENGDIAKLDMIFPLIRFMNKFANVPYWISLAACIFLALQCLTVSYFYDISIVPDLKTMNGNAMRYIILILHFNDVDTSASDSVSLIFFYSYVGMTAMTMALIAFELILYRILRRVNTPIAVLLRFIIEVPIMITFIPMGNYAASEFVMAFEDGKVTHIIYLLSSMVCMAINLFIFQVNFTLGSTSIVIGKSAMLGLANDSVTILVEIATAMAFGQRFFAMFNKWIGFSLMVMGVFIAFGLCYIGYKRSPFSRHSMRVIFCAIFFACGVNVAYAAVYSIYKFQFLFTFLVPFVAFIVSCPILSQLLRMKDRKTAKILSMESVREFIKDPNETPVDMDKEAYLESLGLGNSEALMEEYLRFGLMNGSDLFIDWSLINFALHHYDSNNMVSMCLHFISFFPCEINKMNSLYSTLSKRYDLTYGQRFLVFQIFHLKHIRQTNSQIGLSEKLMELKIMDSNCYNKSISLLRSDPSNFNYILDFAASLKHAKIIWEEIIRDYPNTSSFYTEYCSFLIESATDYDGAAFQQSQKELLDAGKLFSIDYCFFSFIWTFPHYFKKNILEKKGNFVGMKANCKADTHNHSEDEEQSSQSQTTDELISHSRIRTALQKALNGRSSKYSILLLISIVTCLIVSLAVQACLYFFVFQDYFDEIRSIMSQQIYNSRWRLYSAIARLNILQKWATSDGIYYPTALNSAKSSTDKIVSRAVNIFGNLSVGALAGTVVSMSYIVQLLSSITNLANSGVKVTAMESAYTEVNVPLVLCDGMHPLQNTVNVSLAGAVTYLNLLISQVSGVPGNQYDNDTLFCNIMNNIEPISVISDSFSDSVLSYGQSLSNSYQSKATLLACLVTIGLFVVISIPIVVLFLLFIEDIKNSLSAIVSISESEKESSAKPVQKNVTSDDQSMMNSVDESGKWVGLQAIGLFIYNSLVPATLVVAFIYTIYSSENFKSLAGWIVYGVPRDAYLMEGCEHLYIGIMLVGNQSEAYTNRTIQTKYAEDSFEQLSAAQSLLIKGKDTIKPCIGYDSILDQLMYSPVCAPNENITYAHERYVCGSLTDVIETALSFENDIISKMSTNITLVYTVFYDLYHLVNAHLITRTMKVAERLEYLSDVEITKYDTITLTTFIVGTILSVFAFFCEISIWKRCNEAYDAMLAVMRRISPIAFTTNPKLENCLLSRSKGSNFGNSSFGKKVLQISTFPVLILGSEQIIDMVNPAITKLLGFAPEQLLGQSFPNITKEKDEIMHALSSMKNGLSKNEYEQSVNVLTDTEDQKPCKVIVIGIYSKNELTSYVVFLKDERLEVEQQRKAEEARKNNERLISELLPGDFSERIVRDDKELSFTVDRASVMLVNISKFREYSATLTPEQIIGSLTNVFAAYDNAICKYPLVTKLKTYGDTYMCASGLFQKDGKVECSVGQILSFAFDCLSEIALANIKMNSNLSVRIGIFTGGPVHAGIINGRSPIFEIFGEIVNSAQFLESSCVPGKVHTSQSTIDLATTVKFKANPSDLILMSKGKRENAFHINATEDQ